MIPQDILSKFRQLPKEAQDSLNSDKTIEILDVIDKQYPQYDISLAEIVMRLAVKDLDFAQLPDFLVGNYSLNRDRALDITRQLRENISWPITEAMITKQISNNQISNEQLTNNIIERLGLRFPEEFLSNRLKNIVLSYLKDVRDELETRTVLKRSQKIGGMELDDNTIDKIMEILKTQRPQIKIESKVETQRASLSDGLNLLKEAGGDLQEKTQSYQEPLVVEKQELGKGVEPEELPIDAGSIVSAPPILPEKKEEVSTEIVKFETGPLSPPIMPEAKIYPVSVQPTAEQEKEIKPEPIFVTSSDDITKIADEVAKTETTTPRSPIPEISLDAMPTDLQKEEKNIQPEAEQSLIEDIHKESTPLSVEPAPAVEIAKQEPVIQIHRPAPEPPTPSVDLFSSEIDEKKSRIMPKIYGPIDELMALRLEDWRRFSGAKEAVDRVIDKINLLAEQSFLKKAEGIRAWKESEVNRIYLEIGIEAIDTNNSVEEIIRTRVAEHRPTLTLEEFNAIAELNQKLRF